MTLPIIAVCEFFVPQGKGACMYGTHGLSSPKSQGRHLCHTAINKLIQQSLGTAGVPTQLEPSGIGQSDGKRPDGSTVTPWRCGRALAWDYTCPDTFAPSHVMLATSEAGAVADQAEVRKMKYANLQSSHLFVPVAIETAGVFGQEALAFLQELGHRLWVKTGESLSHHHLLQRIAVAMQRGNTATVLGTMTVPNNDINNAYIHLLLNDLLHVCTHICVCQLCISVLPILCCSVYIYIESRLYTFCIKLHINYKFFYWQHLFQLLDFVVQDNPAYMHPLECQSKPDTPGLTYALSMLYVQYMFMAHSFWPFFSIPGRCWRDDYTNIQEHRFWISCSSLWKPDMYTDTRSDLSLLAIHVNLLLYYTALLSVA